MQKKLLLSVLIFAIIVMSLSFALADSCIKTDGAYDVYQKGNVTINTTEGTTTPPGAAGGSATVKGSDNCFDAPFAVPDGTPFNDYLNMLKDNNIAINQWSNFINKPTGEYLMETTCSMGNIIDLNTNQSQTTYLIATSYKCPQGCSNGACIGSSNNQFNTGDITKSAGWCKINGQTVPCSQLFSGTGGITLIVVIALFVIIGILSFIFWIWMLVDCAKREFKDKLVWIIVIVITQIIGALIYYFVIKRKNVTNQNEQLL